MTEPLPGFWSKDPSADTTGSADVVVVGFEATAGGGVGREVVVAAEVAVWLNDGVAGGFIPREVSGLAPRDEHPTVMAAKKTTDPTPSPGLLIIRLVLSSVRPTTDHTRRAH